MNTNIVKTINKTKQVRNPRVSHICKQCDSVYKIPFWLNKQGRGVHFCGLSCYHKSLVGKPSSKRGSKWSLSQREKCSGKNASNWRGGVTRFQNQLRRTALYAEWRDTILKRDNYTCQRCNVRGGTLNVDHYPKPYAVILHENNIKNYKHAEWCSDLWDTTNGRTLCISCHKKTDTYAKRFDLLTPTAVAPAAPTLSTEHLIVTLKRIGSTTFASATGNYALY